MTDAWLASAEAGDPFAPVEHALRARRQGLRASATLAACGGASPVAVRARHLQGRSKPLHGKEAGHAAALAFQ
jgi:hypothetical protein